MALWQILDGLPSSAKWDDIVIWLGSYHKEMLFTSR